MDGKEQEIIMNLIMYGGDGKGYAMEAIKCAKKGDFVKADEKLEQAKKSLLEAHHAQTQLLTNEANGDSNQISLLMIHGQDHLMTSMTFKDLASEIVDLYKKIDEK